MLGSQWGDEGKGKLVDILAQQYDVVARAQACTALCRATVPTQALHLCVSTCVGTRILEMLDGDVMLICRTHDPRAVATIAITDMLSGLLLVGMSHWRDCSPSTGRRKCGAHHL